MTWSLHHHDARHISTLLEPDSVDLIITSPPYFGLRSYRDGGEHYDGQLGSEPTPGEFIDALIACTADWLKVLKPGGSAWINLGDKFSGSGGHNNSNLTGPSAKSTLRGNGHVGGGPKIHAATRNAPDRYNQSSDGIRPKSLMGLPWRYAIRCIDELGLILRRDLIWEKVNHLPESATDRCQTSHEYWFHFVREPRYFAAIDEIREAHIGGGAGVTMDERRADPDMALAMHRNLPARNGGGGKFVTFAGNPLGKAPGSVWSVPSEPLTVPDHLGVDHFAAFPSELVRRIVLGWSPSGFCTARDQPRRAVVDRTYRVDHMMTRRNGAVRTNVDSADDRGGSWARTGEPIEVRIGEATITGYSCACPNTTAPTRPAVILDPFVGTGTVPAVAYHLGRHGVGVDLSRDYLRLAEWRCSGDQRLRDKVLDRSGIPNPAPPKIDGQLGLFGESA